MQTRSGQDRRAEGWKELPETEIKKVRAFDWTKLLLPHAPLILKIIPLLTIGAAGTIAAPKVYEAFNGDVDVPDGELVDEMPTEGRPDYAIAIRAINKKLRDHDAELEAIRAERETGDSDLADRVTELEGQH